MLNLIMTGLPTQVMRSGRLEEIRMTIINNMLQYHPESGESLVAGKPSMGSSRDPTAPLGLKARSVVQTTIEIREDDNGSCSLLDITTRDRWGRALQGRLCVGAGVCVGAGHTAGCALDGSRSSTFTGACSARPRDAQHVLCNKSVAVALA